MACKVAVDKEAVVNEDTNGRASMQLAVQQQPRMSLPATSEVK